MYKKQIAINLESPVVPTGSANHNAFYCGNKPNVCWTQSRQQCLWKLWCLKLQCIWKTMIFRNGVVIRQFYKIQNFVLIFTEMWEEMW